MEEYLKSVPDPENPRKYIGKTLTGRVKPNMIWTASLNYPFQGLSSDSSKTAVWRQWLQDAPTVGFIHDELINQLLICKELPRWLEELMTMQMQAMQELTPDVTVRAEGALMINWDKKAKPVFGIDGHRLRLWTPDIMVPLCSFDRLVPASSLDKNQKKEYSEWLEGKEMALLADRTPAGFRPLFEHGAKSFTGYQPLSSVSDLEIL